MQESSAEYLPWRKLLSLKQLPEQLLGFGRLVFLASFAGWPRKQSLAVVDRQQPTVFRD